VRSPLNSDRKAGFKPCAFGVIGVICVDGIRFLDCGIWEIRMSNLCWVFASFACNSARDGSRVASRLPSMECNGSLSENMVLGSAEGGSRVEEYTELAESESELQKTTIVRATVE